MDKTFIKKAIKYLEKKDIKVIDSNIDKEKLDILLEHRLEELPKRVHLLVNFNGTELLIFLTNKEEFFVSKEKEEKTGGDWPTFQYLYYIEAITKKSVVLLIHEELTNNWLWRQLNQLSKPEAGWRDRCLCKEYGYEEGKKMDCANCWKNKHLTNEKCMKHLQPTALWETDLFSKNYQSIQDKLL